MIDDLVLVGVVTVFLAFVGLVNLLLDHLAVRRWRVSRAAPLRLCPRGCYSQVTAIHDHREGDIDERVFRCIACGACWIETTTTRALE